MSVDLRDDMPFDKQLQHIHAPVYGGCMHLMARVVAKLITYAVCIVVVVVFFKLLG
jgi:hypothetical protein